MKDEIKKNVEINEKKVLKRVVLEEGDILDATAAMIIEPEFLIASRFDPDFAMLFLTFSRALEAIILECNEEITDDEVKS